MNNTALTSLTLTNTFVFVDDPDKALTFYRDVLGLTVNTDVSNGGFRWLTLTTPNQPEMEITLQQPDGMPYSDEDKRAIAEMTAKGLLSALIFKVDDVDAVFEHVRAAAPRCCRSRPTSSTACATARSVTRPGTWCGSTRPCSRAERCVAPGGSGRSPSRPPRTWPPSARPPPAE